MKLINKYIAIFLTTSSHLHPLQVENCDSNSRLVVNEDDNGKFRLEKVNVSCVVFAENISIGGSNRQGDDSAT